MIADQKLLSGTFEAEKLLHWRGAPLSLPTAGLFAHTPLLIASVFPSGCGPRVCVCVRVSGKEYIILYYILYTRVRWIGIYLRLGPSRFLGRIFKTNASSLTHKLNLHTRTHTHTHTHTLCAKEHQSYRDGPPLPFQRTPINDTRPEIEVLAIRTRRPTVGRRPRGYRRKLWSDPKSPLRRLSSGNPFFRYQSFSRRINQIESKKNPEKNISESSKPSENNRIALKSVERRR